MTTNQAIIELAKIIRTMLADGDRRYHLDLVMRDLDHNRGEPHPGPSTHFHSHDTFQAMLRGMTPDPDPLSVEDRLMLYEWALATYIDQMGSNFEYGLCAHMEWIMPSEYHCDNMLAKYFPELYDQKPSHRCSTDYWWPRSGAGVTHRLIALSLAADSCRRQIAAS